MNYNTEPSSESSGIKVSQDVTFKTVDIPVLLGHNIVRTPEFNVRAFIGPVASFIIDKNIDITQGSSGSQQLNNDDFKNAIWGGQIGAGIDVFMISLNARYEFGLNDISNSPILSKTKNNLFLISVGWKIF